MSKKNRIKEPLKIKNLDVSVVPTVAFKGYSWSESRQMVYNNHPEVDTYLPHEKPIILTDSQIYTVYKTIGTAIDNDDWNPILDTNTHLTEKYGDLAIKNSAQKF